MMCEAITYATIPGGAPVPFFWRLCDGLIVLRDPMTLPPAASDQASHCYPPGIALAHSGRYQTEEPPVRGEQTSTMSNRGSRHAGEEMPGREVGVGELDVDLLRLTSLGGGESRSAQYTGTKALMLAILEDGIRSYLSPMSRIRTEAEYWVRTSRQRSPFCFTVVCETLGLEPDAVRAALERLREQNVSPRQALGRSRPNVRRTGRLMGRRSTG